MMNKIQGSRMLAGMCLDVCSQLIARTGVDAQFEIRNVVRNFIGRNNFYGIASGKQIDR